MLSYAALLESLEVSEGGEKKAHMQDFGVVEH